jgi:hypothetical protein
MTTSGAPVMGWMLRVKKQIEAYLDFASLHMRDYKSPNRMGELENVRQK